MSVGEIEYRIVHDGREMTEEPWDHWNIFGSGYCSQRPLREERYQNWCRLMELDPEDVQSMVAYESQVAS